MAVTRNNICKNGMDSLSRGGAVIYYASVFLYFWVFSTPVVSLVVGSYLYVCINWLHLHFDEALKIGSGSFGVVYKGKMTSDTSISRSVVAIKQLFHSGTNFSDVSFNLFRMCYHNAEVLYRRLSSMLSHNSD